MKKAQPQSARSGKFVTERKADRSPGRTVTVHAYAHVILRPGSPPDYFNGNSWTREENEAIGFASKADAVRMIDLHPLFDHRCESKKVRRS